MKNIFYTIAAACILSTTSCEHKNLCYDHAHTGIVNVVFDWRNAPNAAPKSMSCYLFPTDGGEVLRYEFTDRNGGAIRVPAGRYDALCLNSDHGPAVGPRRPGRAFVWSAPCRRYGKRTGGAVSGHALERSCGGYRTESNVRDADRHALSGSIGQPLYGRDP